MKISCLEVEADHRSDGRHDAPRVFVAAIAVGFKMNSALAWRVVVRIYGGVF